VTPPLSWEAFGAVSLPPLTGEGNRRCGGGVVFSTCLTIKFKILIIIIKNLLLKFYKKYVILLYVKLKI